MYNGQVLNDRDRENSFSRTRGSGRSVILQPRYSLCAKFIRPVPFRGSRTQRRHCTNPSLWQRPVVLQRRIFIKDYIPMAIIISNRPRMAFSESRARFYSIYSILRMSGGHKAQSGGAYTLHCLRSSKVRPVRSRKPSPASLNGRRMEMRRDRHRYTATRTSAVDLFAETDMQMTTI